MDIIGYGGYFLGLFWIVRNCAPDPDLQNLAAGSKKFHELILSRGFRDVANEDSTFIICRVLHQRM